MIRIATRDGSLGEPPSQMMECLVNDLDWFIPKVDGDGSIFAFSLPNTSVFPDYISYVIMSDCPASFRIASSSLKSPTICFAPT